jgi:hypothetical protein
MQFFNKEKTQNEPWLCKGKPVSPVEGRYMKEEITIVVKSEIVVTCLGQGNMTIHEAKDLHVVTFHNSCSHKQTSTIQCTKFVDKPYQILHHGNVFFY